MNFILFDENRTNLLPFSYTRPISEFRCGILTIKEKWEKRIPEAEFSNLTEAYLQEKFPLRFNEQKNIYLSANLLSSDDLVNNIHRLQNGEALVDSQDQILAFRSNQKLELVEIQAAKFEKITVLEEAEKIENVWDIFVKNGKEIEKDFKLLTEGRESQSIPDNNIVIGDQVFLEEGAQVQAAVLNSTNGPIYVGKNAEIMEGSVVRGGLALCENGVLKLSTKIYGPTTIGPFSKVGGEVNNSVLFGYSNKGHDGFLGNSVLGEWCNLGADTNVSNLKNNYASIKLWNYQKGGFVDSGRQFCGMMMGDHSKSGINTMFNTATVVGVSSNIYGGGFPRSFIPSFAWGGSEKWMTFRFEKAMEVAQKMMERRKVKLTEADFRLLKHVFDTSTTYRNF
ncbi:MAG: GlmU family protein [Vicingaceae bacterium]